MLVTIINLIFNIINNDIYLATRRCYPSDKNVKWYDETFLW